ncbi:unnamed protein product [Lactuca virosa]|uniref:Uncharacterized protein n=1 Tax=Lactuca virosa TaxID=75947 RepID=A0AAU9PKF1_9ASTR|nr:unnamed protein product [Lactuca virosa]
MLVVLGFQAKQNVHENSNTPAQPSRGSVHQSEQVRPGMATRSLTSSSTAWHRPWVFFRSFTTSLAVRVTLVPRGKAAIGKAAAGALGWRREKEKENGEWRGGGNSRTRQSRRRPILAGRK